ncbi:hypothetical protein [Solimonas sp. SE-A11]|uniref:hypothetical protein n=1 Tax=Solimonas sp. SE-A11 TaxID=3054954 RepID=UPI00259C9928|nr:hypothetical protein [Solimonas sp. SE-A11]MDM4768680.1 hypothetical protein [Solimonas sp. SE-A11]
MAAPIPAGPLQTLRTHLVRREQKNFVLREAYLSVFGFCWATYRDRHPQEDDGKIWALIAVGAACDCMTLIRNDPLARFVLPASQFVAEPEGLQWFRDWTPHALVVALSAMPVEGFVREVAAQAAADRHSPAASLLASIAELSIGFSPAVALGPVLTDYLKQDLPAVRKALLS